MTDKQIIIDNSLCTDQIACMNRYEVARLFIKTVELLAIKEQKLEKIKQYVEDNEWCLLDDTYKELLQIIEGKENG